MSRDRQPGFVLLEVTIALVVFGVMLSWAFTGSSGQLRYAGLAFEQTRAERLAAGRLEQLRPASAPLAPGVTDFAIPTAMGDGLVDAVGQQEVRAIEPGLFEVAVTIRWGPRDATRRSQSRLVTLIERRME